MEAQPEYLLFILATCITLAFPQDPLKYNVEKLGGELTVDCTLNDIPDTELSHWVLNDLTVLRNGQKNGMFIANSKRLYILKVDKSTFGDYFCVLNRREQNGNDTLLYFKSTVAKEVESLWDQFSSQTIVGVVASVVTLVVLIGLCLVWRYRWRPERQNIVAVNGGNDKADGYQSSGKVPEDNYPAFETDKGFVNETFAKSAPPERHSIIVDDTHF